MAIFCATFDQETQAIAGETNPISYTAKVEACTVEGQPGVFTYRKLPDPEKGTGMTGKCFSGTVSTEGSDGALNAMAQLFDSILNGGQTTAERTFSYPVGGQFVVGNMKLTLFGNVELRPGKRFNFVCHK